MLTLNTFKAMQTSATNSSNEEIDCESPVEQTKPRSMFIPRGIINPNYPGFQKFAHTLTEHYIEYSPSDYYESDISDYDIETDHINADTCNHNYSSHINRSIFAENKIKNENLTLCENGNILSSTVESTKLLDQKLNNIFNSSTDTTIYQNTIPMAPDILIENCKPQMDLKIKTPNYPDLLNNVGPYLTKIEQTATKPTTNLELAKKSKEEHVMSLTPIDIIGDFGKEVERELDLLISGYKNIKADDNFESLAVKKICDAALSNASDNLKIQRSSQYGNDTIEKHDYGIKINVKHGKFLGKPKYQKSSHDEKQLPPVVIDYKQPQYNQRLPKKNKSKTNISNAQTFGESKLPITKKQLKPINNKSTNNQDKNEDILDNEEITQYREIVSNKDQIISNSRYTKTSCWAQYLEGTLKDKQSLEHTNPSVLDQFDAYKVSEDVDLQTLKNHFKMAKKIEKTRRNNREEIRKRLAMEVEPFRMDFNNQIIKSVSIENKLFDDINSIADNLSDVESYSSDSESCPKLSRGAHRSTSTIFSMENNQKADNKSLNSDVQDRFQGVSAKDNQIERCDFFTMQSKLQIEARMALAQSKEVAQFKMKIEKQKQAISPITEQIRFMIEKVGMRMDSNQRWISRQMLTEINTMQLKFLVDNLNVYIEKLNANLVRYLMERDELHSSQDAILYDIENLSRYIVSKEQTASGQIYYV